MSGSYDDSFTTTYGTIKYSIDGGNSYNEISANSVQGNNGEGEEARVSYTITTSSENILLKIKPVTGMTYHGSSEESTITVNPSDTKFVSFDVAPQNSETYEVRFGTGSWTVGNVNVTTINKTETQMLTAADTIMLTNFDIDTMEVRLRASDGFSTTLTVTDGKTAISNYQADGCLPMGADYFTFEVVEKSNNNGGDDNPEETVPNGYLYIRDVNYQNIDYVTAQSDFGYIQYTVDGNTWNWVTESMKNESVLEDTTVYNISNATGIRVLSQYEYTCSLRGNSTDVMENEIRLAILDLTTGEIIPEENYSNWEEFENDENLIMVRVNECSLLDNSTFNSDGYTLTFNPHNILWYNDLDTAVEHQNVDKTESDWYEKLVEDCLVVNGYVDIISCVSVENASYAGKEINDEKIRWSGVCGEQESGNWYDPITGKLLGAGLAAYEGSILTLKFVPYYGYQFTEASINGNELTPVEGEPYTYTFTFPRGTFHMSAMFKSAEEAGTSDIADGFATGFGSVKSVSGTDGDKSINGNLKLIGNDAAISEGMEKSMETALENSNNHMEIIDGAYIELNLGSYAKKGDLNEFWNVPLTETDENVMITLAVTDEVAAKIEAANGKCSIVRQHISGDNVSYTVLHAIYNAEDKTVTFESNQFSTFALATDSLEEYSITEGADGNVSYDSGTYRIKVDADYSKFVSLYIDGYEVSKDNYTVEKGSTIITLKAAYVNTLLDGAHTIRVNYTDGYAETKLTISRPSGDLDKSQENTTKTVVKNNKVPKAGDNTPFGLFMTLELISGAALILIIKKRVICR